MTDFRDAFRALRANPVVSAVAVLSLALGIGANTAIFSMIDTLMLRSLPVPGADRLATLTTTKGNADWTNPLWEELRGGPSLFDGATAWAGATFNLAPSGQTDLVDGIIASGSFFGVLHVPAILGRTFTPADDRRDGGLDGPVAVISYAYWQRRFGGSPSAVGQTLTLNGIPFTVVGVTPPEFFGPEVGRRFDVAVPLGTLQVMYGAASGLDSRSSWWLTVMIRLKASQSTEEATSVVRSLQRQWREATIPQGVGRAYQDAYLTDPFVVADAARGHSALRAHYERPLVTLLVIVGLVLLIACGNIANLQVARAIARRGEFSLRTALGAPGTRLVRQLLVESAMLSAAGAATGIVIAFWGSRLLVSQLTTATSRVALDVGLDWRVLGFTATIATVTTALFGAAPAAWAATVQPSDALRQHGGDSSREGRFGLGGVLMIGQLALSLLLVVGAGLFVRSFNSLAHLNPGFDAGRVLTALVDIQATRVRPADRASLYQRISTQVGALPGVVSAAVSFRTPVCGCGQDDHIEIPGLDLPATNRGAWFNTVGPGWFATYGTPLQAGRDLDGRDRSDGPRVIIVNEAFAKKYFAGENPLGHRVVVGIGTDTVSAAHEIVGVVGDAVYRSLREPAPPTVYFPLSQRGALWSAMTLSVRTVGSPAQLVRSVTSAIGAAEPRAKLTFRVLSDVVRASLVQERQIAMLSAFFGALALLLAGLGVYGVTSHAVNRRRVEIGIRMALGTTPGGIMRLVFRRVGAQLGVGIAVGGLGAWWGSRLVEKMLFGLTPGDVWTMSGAILVLVTVGGVAAFVPARRAAGVDPTEVLRAG